MSGRFEDGAVLPLAVIALFAIVGLVGLVTDYAPLFWDRNKIQNATDAAALAAAEYLKKNPSAKEAEVQAQAELVFKSQMPAGASLEKVTVDGDSVRVEANFSHNTFLTQIFPGAKPTITVSAESFAKQQTIETVQACVSPMVICSDTDLQASTSKLSLNVGTNIVFLCEDVEGNLTGNCDKLDERMAKGSYPFGGGVIDPKANGAICYKIPGKSSKGRATGQYRGGLNSRFFDCGISGARPAPGLPSGFANCTQGASYKRDEVSWTGFKIDSSSANIGNLNYQAYNNISGYRDLWGCTSNWRSSSTSCGTSGSSSWVNVQQNTAKDRRTLIVAQVPKAACTSGAVEFDSSQVKVKCLFLRQPVGTSDNRIYAEITDADCGSLATAGAGNSRKNVTRLFE